MNDGPYHDPDYRWSTAEFLYNPAERYGLQNMATMLGPTHIRDPETGNPYNLNVLDTIPYEVTKRLNTPIGEILHLPSGHHWVNEKVRDIFLNDSFPVSVSLMAIITTRFWTSSRNPPS